VVCRVVPRQLPQRVAQPHLGGEARRPPKVVDHLRGRRHRAPRAPASREHPLPAAVHCCKARGAARGAGGLSVLHEGACLTAVTVPGAPVQLVGGAPCRATPGAGRSRSPSRPTAGRSGRRRGPGSRATRGAAAPRGCRASACPCLAEVRGMGRRDWVVSWRGRCAAAMRVHHPGAQLPAGQLGELVAARAPTMAAHPPW
jgi:hypothetical protein